MHTLVYVILQRDNESIEEHVNKVLAGSNADSSKAYPSYNAPCSCCGSVARNRAFKIVDGSVKGKLWLEDLSAARKRNDESAERRILEIRFAEVQALEEEDPDYGKIDPQCDICDGNGLFSCSRDPAETFDWWVVGGRWKGLFDAITTQMSGHPKSLSGNIATVSEVLSLGVPAAIVTPEGHLYEGPMVMDTFEHKLQPWERQERDQWKTQAEQLLYTYSDCVVVAIDCHS